MRVHQADHPHSFHNISIAGLQMCFPSFPQDRKYVYISLMRLERTSMYTGEVEGGCEAGQVGRRWTTVDNVDK